MKTEPTLDALLEALGPEGSVSACRMGNQFQAYARRHGRATWTFRSGASLPAALRDVLLAEAAETDIDDLVG